MSGLEVQWDIVFAQYQFVSYMVYYPIVVGMFLLYCFSDSAPKNSTYRKYNNPSKEMSASFFSKVFFQWFDVTTWVGYRRTLTEEDM